MKMANYIDSSCYLLYLTSFRKLVSNVVVGNTVNAYDASTNSKGSDTISSITGWGSANAIALTGSLGGSTSYAVVKSDCSVMKSDETWIAASSIAVNDTVKGMTASTGNDTITITGVQTITVSAFKSFVGTTIKTVATNKTGNAYFIVKSQ